ncbi:chaperone [Lithospermum erythrorhizon]|uniref:Chaperone n=1 Tax=Lithospermum erythrorhizon TaxID=34254 RepID=A0AAV3QMY2_LITER
MATEVDHYVVLGLPSCEEGAKLSDKDITTAYKSKGLELHPDKSPHDPNAHVNFQNLKESYQVLKDEKERKKFDALLRVESEKIRCRFRKDPKRKKRMDDLEERERSKSRKEEEEEEEEDKIISRKVKEEIAAIISAIISEKTKVSAVVVMASNNATVAAIGSDLGYVSNPLTIKKIPKRKLTSQGSATRPAFRQNLLM